MVQQADHSTIHFTLRNWAERAPESLAIAAPGRTSLTYFRLWDQIARGARILNGLGVGKGDLIALVLPQGPEMTTAVLTVAAVAAAVPLNPGLKGKDFEFTCKALDIRAFIGPEDADCLARDVARKQKIPFIGLAALPGGPAGFFALNGMRGKASRSTIFNSADDMAVVLSTSGTTSDPKFVPLTHRIIRAAADNTSTALVIRPQDRGLIVSPLFHAHGLVAGVIASLMSGATAICPPAFDAVAFFEWLDEFRPTWYTAVPGVHQAVLQEAPRHKDVIDRQNLRLIRSASAYLPEGIRTELEEVFITIVTEGYGLTEAMQLTNTPLDLHTRKIGSLGLSGTSRVGIMDETGALLGAGQSGEIVAKGPVVMSGYLNDSDATSTAFRNGWLRTGDLGYIDADGHLYMTGRLKDQINRGGEKISPQEIDQVLLMHPGISQAMAFSIPHPALGEEVAAAVVLHPGSLLRAEDIRQYAAARLQEHKVPRRVFIVPSMPSNSIGKLSRRILASWLANSHTRPPYAAPRNAIEQTLIGIWEHLFKAESLGIDDDFFDLGGNSLLAVTLFAEISRELAGDLRIRAIGKEGAGAMRPSILWHASTVRRLAEHLSGLMDAEAMVRPLIEVQRGNAGHIPLFLLTGDWHGMGFYVRNLARHLDAAQPVYALMPHDITAEGTPQTIEAMAEAFTAILRAAQPTGPYLLAGYSHAGLVAFEMARRIQASGEKIALLFAVDTLMPDPRLRYLLGSIRRLSRILGWTSQQEVEKYLTWKYRLSHFSELWGEGAISTICYYLRRAYRRPPLDSPGDALSWGADQLTIRYSCAVRQYVPRFYSDQATVLTSLEGPASLIGDPTLGWPRVARHVRIFRVPGNHVTCITEFAEEIAAHLKLCLEEAVGGGTKSHCLRRRPSARAAGKDAELRW